MNESRRKFSLRLLRFLYFVFMFVLGILMALGFAKLISHTNPGGDTVVKGMPYLLEWLNNANPLYLSLTLAGTMGAILHTILIHGQLDLPSWSEDDTGLKLGFLGEIFIGISGAFIAYVFVPTDYLSGINSGIKVFVTGLVGGYGGQLILNALLKKQLELIARADLAQKDAKQANAEKEQIAEGKDLLVQVNRQIQNGLTETELLDLQKKIPKANLEDRELIFYRASDARRAAQRSKSSTFRLRIQRSVPILKSLVESDNSNPDYHAQLAFAYVDSEPPLLAEAISNLDSAIEIRGSSIREDSWKYELYRAIARIKLTRQVGETANKASQGREEILRDLVAVDHNKGIAQTLREYESDGVDIPVKDWLTQNQEWLRQQNESKDLLNSIFPSPLKQATLLSLQPSNYDSSQNPGALPASISIPPEPTTKNLGLEAIYSEQISTKTMVQPDRWDIALAKAAKAATSGASAITARQDGLPAGIPTSHKMAQTDWSGIEPIKERFYQASVKYDVPPAILAGIASRESRATKALINGLGDNGNAFGIMQIDSRYHKQVGEGGDPASQAHIDQAAGIFADFLKEVQKNHPQWEDEYILKGACAAYNSGVENIQTTLGIDQGTTGDDYGSDVIARAEFYASRLKSLAECKAEQTPRSYQKPPVTLGQTSIAAAESSCLTRKIEAFKEIPPNLTSTDVNWSDMSFHLTQNFTLGENLMHDSERIPTSSTVQSKILTIMRELQKIRDDYGKPISITSGYRPESINEKVRGVRNSRHISGDAVDICPSDPQADIYEFQKWLDQNWYGALGYGAAKGFVHIDCRNGLGWKTGGQKDNLLRWDY